MVAALPHPLQSLLRAGVLLAGAATALPAQTEYPYAAGTDAAGRAQAVSDAAGRVLIESPEFPLGVWVNLVDEGGRGLVGIQVEYEGRPDSLVALRCLDPAGLRRERGHAPPTLQVLLPLEPRQGQGAPPRDGPPWKVTPGRSDFGVSTPSAWRA